MIGEAPPGVIQPGASLLHAVDVAGDHGDPVPKLRGVHPSAGQLDGCGQLEDGSGEVLVTLGDGDRP